MVVDEVVLAVLAVSCTGGGGGCKKLIALSSGCLLCLQMTTTRGSAKAAAGGPKGSRLWGSAAPLLLGIFLRWKFISISISISIYGVYILT